VTTAVVAIELLLMAGFAAFGVLLVAQPEKCQRYTLSVYKNPTLANLNPFLGWMQRASFLTFLRFMVCTYILFAALALYFFLAGGMWK